jgi:hypothetical protein
MIRNYFNNLRGARHKGYNILLTKGRENGVKLQRRWITVQSRSDQRADYIDYKLDLNRIPPNHKRVVQERLKDEVMEGTLELNRREDPVESPYHSYTSEVMFRWTAFMEPERQHRTFVVDSMPTGRSRPQIIPHVSNGIEPVFYDPEGSPFSHPLDDEDGDDAEGTSPLEQGLRLHRLMELYREAGNE